VKDVLEISLPPFIKRWRIWGLDFCVTERSVNVLTYQSFFRPNLISPPVSVFVFDFFGAIYTFGLNETNDASPLIWHQKTVEIPATDYSLTVPQLRVILSRRSKNTRRGWRKRKPQEM